MPQAADIPNKRDPTARHAEGQCVMVKTPGGESIGYRIGDKWFAVVDGPDVDVTTGIAEWRHLEGDEKAYVDAPKDAPAPARPLPPGSHRRTPL